MKADQELLSEFVRDHSEQAFAELVKRHIGVVFGAALREANGNEPTAHDITQLVFIELAHKAANLQKHPALAGWLYTSVRFVSANIRRGEQRRRLREQEAYFMSQLHPSTAPSPEWEELKPVLDDAMHELNETDRTAVILRFFEGRSLREIGGALRLKENAARMRVDRALDKLQKLLAKRGIRSSSSLLARTLPAGIVLASPELIAEVTGSALSTALATSTSTSTLIGFTTMAKLKLIGAGTLLVATVSLVTWEEVQRRETLTENLQLRKAVEEVAALREQNALLLQQNRDLEEIRQNELRELADLRGQRFTKRTSQTGLQSSSENEPDGEWRARFDAQYRLGPGEVIRRVARFGPERNQFYKHEFPGRAQTTERVPDYFVLTEDENGQRLPGTFSGSAGGEPTLDHVLRYAMGLGRHEYLGDEELFELKVPGDWVIREGSTMEARLAALEPILRDATGRNIRFEKQFVEEEVIVVRGQFSPQDRAGIDIYATRKNSAGGATGNFDTLLQRLGDRLNIRFVNEANVSSGDKLAWTYHTDSRFDRRGDGAGVPMAVLDNLTSQTGLQFELQKRPVPTWIVTD